MKPYYLSLKPYLFWRSETKPFQWDRLFQDEAPVWVEIGFGNGEYLARNARAHADYNFLGIELEWASVKRALRRIAQAGVSNTLVAQVDARVAFEWLIQPQSVSKISSLFPIPWPKERHEPRRLFSNQFLKLANSRLKDGGELSVVTDDALYAEWIESQAEDAGMELTLITEPAQYDTKYERKWSEQGQKNFFALQFRKIEHIDIPLKTEITLKTYRIKDFDPERFSPAGQGGPVSVNFKEFLFDPKLKKGMLRTVTAEDELIQHFWIEVAYDEHDWIIRPSRGSAFTPTVGVQLALDLAHHAAL